MVLRLLLCLLTAFSILVNAYAGSDMLPYPPKLNGDATDAKTLDLYLNQVSSSFAQGSWTPIDASGAGLTLTLTGTPTYTKIGNLVWASAWVTYPATANASGAIIGGLPFTAYNNQGNRGGGMIAYTDSTLSFTITPVGASTQIYIWSLAGAQITNIQLSGKQIIFSVLYQT